jgi:hypothetical protein
MSSLTDQMERCNGELEAAFGRVDLAGFDRISARFDALADRYRDLFARLEGAPAGSRSGVPPMPEKFVPRRRRRLLVRWRRRHDGPAGSVMAEPVATRTGRHVLR